MMAHLAERMNQMNMARGSTAPPSEVGSYMTATSDSMVPQQVHTQAQQRIAQLEKELAKSQAAATINAAAAASFPLSNYGYNVELCPGPPAEPLYTTCGPHLPGAAAISLAHVPVRPGVAVVESSGCSPQARTAAPPTSQHATYKAAARVSFASDQPVANAVCRHLVSFVTNPKLTAEAQAEKNMYQPTLPVKATLDTSRVAWGKVLPGLQEVCRLIAVTKGGRTRSSPAEDKLIQVMTEFDLLGDNIALHAVVPTAPPHLANKRMTLAFFDNNDAASGMTTYGKDGQPQLRKRILVDTGANVLCINRDVATDCPLPMLSCNANIKTFGDNKVSVIGKILDYPMTFCRGTEWEVTIRCTALVYDTGTTWEILAGMPVVNHHAVNLWPCAFLGGVVMFPRLANANYESILALPVGERCKHLGAMIVLPAAMTEYDNGQGAFSAAAYVTDVIAHPDISSVTDTVQIVAPKATHPHISSVTDTAQIVARRPAHQDAAPSLQDF